MQIFCLLLTITASQKWITVCWLCVFKFCALNCIFWSAWMCCCWRQSSNSTSTLKSSSPGWRGGGVCTGGLLKAIIRASSLDSLLKVDEMDPSIALAKSVYAWLVDVCLWFDFFFFSQNCRFNQGFTIQSMSLLIRWRETMKGVKFVL